MSILKIRSEAFETNSSSSHSLIISKTLDDKDLVVPELFKQLESIGFDYKHVLFGSGYDLDYYIEKVNHPIIKLDYMVSNLIDYIGESIKFYKKITPELRELVDTRITIYKQNKIEINIPKSDDDILNMGFDLFSYFDYNISPYRHLDIQAFNEYLNKHNQEMILIKKSFEEVTGVDLVVEIPSSGVSGLYAGQVSGNTKEYLDDMIFSKGIEVVKHWLFNPNSWLYIN